MKKRLLLHKRIKAGFVMALAIMVVLSASLVLPALTDAAGVTIITVTMVDGTGNNVTSTSTAVATTTVVFDPETDVNTDDGIKVTFYGVCSGGTNDGTGCLYDGTCTGGGTCSLFDISSVVAADIALTQTNSGSNITYDNVGNPADLYGVCNGGTEDGNDCDPAAAVCSGGGGTCNASSIRIPVDAEGDTPGGQITATISNSHITTPATEETYTVQVDTYDLGADTAFGGGDDVSEDSGASAIIVGDSTVTISGTVDPTLTLNLYQEGTTTTTSTCELGVLESDQISTCSYDVVVTSNATNGYSGYIRQDAAMTNSATDTLDAVADNNITPTATSTEEYGVALATVDTLGGDIGIATEYDSGGRTCTDTAPTGWLDEATSALDAFDLTTSDQEFVTYNTSGIDGTNHGLTTLCHAAAIAGDTEAGVYTQTVTVTVVGNF